MKYVTHVMFLISVVLFALFLRKLSGRVVTFASHMEEFPKSPSPNYGGDQNLHTLIQELPSKTEQSQRYLENAD